MKIRSRLSIRDPDYSAYTQLFLKKASQSFNVPYKLQKDFIDIMLGRKEPDSEDLEETLPDEGIDSIEPLA